MIYKSLEFFHFTCYFFLSFLKFGPWELTLLKVVYGSESIFNTHLVVREPEIFQIICQKQYNFCVVEKPQSCHLINLFSSTVKHPLGSPNKFQETFMENLQRAGETSKKDRGHRRTEPSQNKGRGLCAHSTCSLVIRVAV